MTDARSNKFKNPNIELMRVVLTIAICLHHFRLYSDDLPYGGGYLATDCFFLISGFFLYRGISKYEYKGKIWSSLKNYTLSRISRLLPQYLIAVLFGTIVYKLFVPRQLPENPIEYVCELFMIPLMNSDASVRIIPPDWYVGYLLLASLLVFVFMIMLHEPRKHLLLLLILIICGYSANILLTGNICTYPQYRGTFSFLTLCRAVSGVSIGVLAGIIIERFERIFRIIWRQRFICFLLVAILSLTNIYFLLWYDGWSGLDILAIMLFALMFVLVVSMEQTFSNSIYRLICWISGICYTIYLNHYLVAYVFSYYNIGRNFDWKVVSLLYLIAIFGFSVIMYYAYIMLNRLRQKIVL